MNPRPAAVCDVTLLDVLDRVLQTGVVVRGDLVISVADVDLLALDLALVLGSIESILGQTAPVEKLTCRS